VPTFADRWVSRGQGGGSPTVVNVSVLDRSRYFLSSSSSFIFTRAEWTPFQNHCYLENLAALGIEPETSGFCSQEAWPRDHRGGLLLLIALSIYLWDTPVPCFIKICLVIWWGETLPLCVYSVPGLLDTWTRRDNVVQLLHRERFSSRSTRNSFPHDSLVTPRAANRSNRTS
jgi:hypothetical protein